MKAARIFCLALFFLVLCVPVTQRAFKIFRTHRVYGVGTPRFPEDMSKTAVLEGTFQSSFDRWFTRRNGMWEFFVRLDNQLNFSLFDQSASSYNTPVLIGKNNTLFQRFYLDEYNRAMSVPEPMLLNRVTLLKQTQDALARRGIPMVYVISASHLSVNQSFLEPQFISPNRDVRVGNYERMLPMLKEAGVNLIDEVEFFRNEFRDGRLHFTPSGSHWDSVGACFVASHILDFGSKATGKPMVDMKCQPIVERAKPRRPELDLVQISNFWTDTPYDIATKYPNPTLIRTKDTYKPNILIVGTSYMYTVLNFLERRKTARRIDFFFYYREHRSFPNNKTRELDPATINWEELMKGRDLVVIESSSAIMTEAGQGFLKDAIEHLS